jgi:hypothetical protein
MPDQLTPEQKLAAVMGISVGLSSGILGYRVLKYLAESDSNKDDKTVADILKGAIKTGMEKGKRGELPIDPFTEFFLMPPGWREALTQLGVM